jgi:phosphatidylserine decarboxylase
MKQAGKARKAGLRIIGRTFILLVAVLAGGVLAAAVGSLIVAAGTLLILAWILFALFALNFFRDPEPKVPAEPQAIVSAGHGKIDVIDETSECEFMGGQCKRISMFLSVIDVHVQNAPIAGTVAYLKHCPGQFVNAMRTDCSSYNENVLIGFESGERQGEKVGVRLIAGYLARRIIPWVTTGDSVARGERISLIQFGSRVDIYLPLDVIVQVKLGQRVKGGETIIATRP